jgi:acyl carrier protein
MNGKSEDMKRRLETLIRAILVENGVDRPFKFTDRLAEIGLTSMDMVSLMLGIEGEFELIFPETEITPENFNSVATIEAVVRRLLQVDHVHG